ncbi:MAG: tRNA (guanosine(37)-N1)-methyltransferase TrmD, partial [Leadbetterella sp.]|nr:tRNA (guanosine(37)-N1)-methyltransferase TrmD [Leadbetterella sp.]
FVEINIHDLRPFGNGNYRQIDDYQYGGGAGMVLMIEPLAKLIRQLQEKTTYDQVIYLTPDGKTLNQKSVNKLSLSKNLLMICGHYKGIDERVRELFVTQEISIGDYVLSGGEIAAAVLTDAIVRLIPGVINDETSALTDSFQDDLLAPPVYTRPADFEGTKVPEILMSGNEKLINDWRLEKSIERTTQRRPDLLPK